MHPPWDAPDFNSRRFACLDPMAFAAQGEWPEFMKLQFIESSCIPSLEAEGYEAPAVQTFCSCFADQIEANFSPIGAAKPKW